MPEFAYPPKKEGRLATHPWSKDNSGFMKDATAPPNKKDQLKKFKGGFDPDDKDYKRGKTNQ